MLPAKRKQAPAEIVPASAAVKFVAVRKGRSVKRCIFQNWQDAKEHLQEPDAQFSLCETIEEAVSYAFDQQEVPESRDSQPSASAIEDLVDGILYTVFSFVCKFPERGLGGFVMASKLCLQRCVRFVQQIPQEIIVLDTHVQSNLKLPLWLSCNQAKLGVACLHSSKVINWSLFMYYLSNCDITGLKSFEMFAAAKIYPSHEENWAAAKAGAPLDVVVQSETFGYADYIQRIVPMLTSQAKQLNSLGISLSSNHFNLQQPLLVSFSNSLVRLCLELQPTSDNENYTNLWTNAFRTISQAIEKMTKLKHLWIYFDTSVFDPVFMDEIEMRNNPVIDIRSDTLQDISLYESEFRSSFPTCLVRDCICPLEELEFALELHQPNMSILRKHSQTIKVLTVQITNTLSDRDNLLGVPIGNIPRDRDSYMRNFRQLLAIIEGMPKLKELTLFIHCDFDERWRDVFTIRSSSLDTIAIWTKEHLAFDFPVSQFICPSLKALSIWAAIHKPLLPHLSNLCDTLEELTLITIVESVNPTEVVSSDSINEAISGMLKLKKLNIEVPFGYLRLSIRSASLEEIDVSRSQLLAGVCMEECVCPSLRLITCDSSCQVGDTTYLLPTMEDRLTDGSSSARFLEASRLERPVKVSLRECSFIDASAPATCVVYQRNVRAKYAALSRDPVIMQTM